MRIWSLHPRYLDARGLVALWRETLLAQAVLLGRTKGYTRHPQLDRFRAGARPAALVATYLDDVRREALTRGYAFAADRIDPARTRAKLRVTDGQLAYEWRHLMAKLEVRDPPRAEAWKNVRRPDPHPLFEVIPGDVEAWEKIAPVARSSRH